MPSLVAHDLDNDPEQLAQIGVQLLHFSNAHSAFKRANKKEMERWEGDAMMEFIEELEFEDVAKQIEAQKK